MWFRTNPLESQTLWECEKELKKKKKLLVKAEQVAVHMGNNFWVRELKKEVTKLMIKENRMWRQRANFFWLD